MFVIDPSTGVYDPILDILQRTDLNPIITAAIGKCFDGLQAPPEVQEVLKDDLRAADMYEAMRESERYAAILALDVLKPHIESLRAISMKEAAVFDLLVATLKWFEAEPNEHSSRLSDALLLDQAVTLARTYRKHRLNDELDAGEMLEKWIRAWIMHIEQYGQLEEPGFFVNDHIPIDQIG